MKRTIKRTYILSEDDVKHAVYNWLKDSPMGHAVPPGASSNIELTADANGAELRSLTLEWAEEDEV